MAPSTKKTKAALSKLAARKSARKPVKQARTSKGKTNSRCSKSSISSTQKELKTRKQTDDIKNYVEKNDELLDFAPGHPLTVSEILSDKLNHKTFVQNNEVHEYDWSALKEEFEKRNGSSPRWFMQIREEELLLGPDGLDGVTVDCVIIAEASVPTLSPSEYIVKEHYPYSDLEDNTPERILPLFGQAMCWRRVVRDDGVDINAFLLQKRTDPIRAQNSVSENQNEGAEDKQTNSNYHNTDTVDKPATTLVNSSVESKAVLDATSFGFGSNNNSNIITSFGNGSNNNNSTNAQSINTISGGGTAMTTFHNFGFAGVESGAAASTEKVIAPEPIASSSLPSAAMFGFGNTNSATPAMTHNDQVTEVKQTENATISKNLFGFGQSSTETHTANGYNNANILSSKSQEEKHEEEETEEEKEEEEQESVLLHKDEKDEMHTTEKRRENIALRTAELKAAALLKVKPLKTSSVLFALWTRKRLQTMANEINSGSRLVRKQFMIDEQSNKHVNLIMQNDRKDNIKATVKGIILNKIFAKEDKSIVAIDDWMDKCPMYDETLITSLQRFRENYLKRLANESTVFKAQYDKFHTAMEDELKRIIAIRKYAASHELEMISQILERIRKHYLAEKTNFRLLKYYPKNDIQPFRPFGKISGISEMGEMVDVCVPPAHVNVNPFTLIAK